MRLKHVATSTWVRAIHNEGGPTGDQVAVKVASHVDRDDREAFSILPVSVAEIRDLDFCADSHRVLAYNARRLKTGSITAVERRQLQDLLADLIMFLMNEDASRVREREGGRGEAMEFLL